ncbi:hypothetical protein QDA02_gp27 [Microbacterium phage Margaery]|uniref:Uncharacterized protein n=1 Tax=Microbacterium phage Margaery TaxID=2591217 RepID=A0A514DHP7_9CAUD|nr:hypothetical protein QDA02_gp27 [Microbacterium phage Margaery]QDH93138.1 hypothetical protein PBI_MARGAERY_81 [Microbacterium phage Margaery]
MGGPHDGKTIALAAEKMILRTSSGVYMRHADRPEYLFHVPSLLATA